MIETCFGDAEAHEAVAERPDMHILIARPPARDWPRLTGTAMTLVYKADTIVRSNPHLKLAKAYGMGGELVDARQGRGTAA